jgi:hypothetical protein
MMGFSGTAGAVVNTMLLHPTIQVDSKQPKKQAQFGYKTLTMASQFANQVSMD